MASGKDVRAGGAFVEIFSKNTALYQGLKAAENRMRSTAKVVAGIGGGLAGIGVGVAGPLIAAGIAFADFGSEARDGAAKVGISTEAFTELKFVAEQSGTSIDTLSGGLKLMEKHLAEAASGSFEANKDLADLGLTIHDLQGLSPDKQFEKLADGIARIQDPSIRTATAMKLFGKSGVELIPVLQEGSKGITDLRNKARELGLSMSGEDAAAAGDLGDNWDALKATGQGLFVLIGSTLAPTFSELIAYLTGLAVGTREWIANNRQLINTIFRVGAVVAITGGALLAIGGVGAVLATVIGGLITIGTGLAAVFGLLVSPIGLVIVGVAGLTAAFFTLTETGQATLGTLYEDFSLTFGGIMDALASGDLMGAAEILWDGLQLTFARGWQFINAGWLDFKNGVVDVIDSMLTDLRIKIDEWFPGFEQGFADTFGFVQDAWTLTVNSFLYVWDAAFSILKKSLNYLRSLFDSTFDLSSANKAIDQQFAKSIEGRQSAQDDLLGKRDAERRRRSQELAEKGTSAVLNKERADRATQRRKDADDQKAADLASIETKKAALKSAVESAKQERAERKKALDDKMTKGATTAQSATAETSKKGAEALDIRTSGGLALLARVARGGSPQQQMIDLAKQQAEQAKKGNEWNQKQWQELNSINKNLPMEATSIDGNG